MPKFYKKNILASQLVDTPLHQEVHFNQAPPHPEEPLLPSPLDTPELMPPHEPIPEEPHPGPVFKPQPIQIPISIGTPGAPVTAPIPESHLVQNLLSWTAPSRPHRKKDRSFYTTVAILIILIAMIALLAGERMLVAVLFALMFLVYVLNFIEPQEIEYKLSTQGVTVDEHFYHWQELDSFWFEKKDGFTVLHILTQLKFPAMLMLVLAPTINEEDVKKTTARFLPFHEIAPKSIIDKWAQSLQRYFPLENPHK